jgi:hypothetical protein
MNFIKLIFLKKNYEIKLILNNEINFFLIKNNKKIYEKIQVKILQPH